LSAFYNVYDHLRSSTDWPSDPNFRLPFAFFYENDYEGETYGRGDTLTWQALEWWNLHTAYYYLEGDIRVKSGRADFNSALNENADPKHRFSLRSSMELTEDVTLDAGYRWIDGFAYNNAGTAEGFPGYEELEVSLGW